MRDVMPVAAGGCAGPVVLGRTPEELLELAAEDGQPAYRAKQLMDGILHGARSIDDIGNVRHCSPRSMGLCHSYCWDECPSPW